MIQLFGLYQSVYTRIARIALEEKGVAYTLEQVDVFATAGIPPSYRALNPFGYIPSLKQADFNLYETTAICRYIDEAFEGPPLQAENPAARAVMNQIISLLDSYAYRPMIWDVYVQRVVNPAEGEPTNEQQIAAALPGLRIVLQELERLRGHHPCLCGESISLADLHLYPMLFYFVETPEGAAMLEDFAGLRSWMKAMQSRPSVVSSCTP